jgi:hypothetical protein
MTRGPSIIVENWEGKSNCEENYAKYKEMGLYRNLATVWITPTRGTMQTKVAFNWMGIAGGFNQPLAKMCIEGCEVGAAYNYAIKEILANPGLKNFQYILTVEEDNTAPPDALHKLYQSIQEYDAVSGLYWTKGAGGAPQIWGNGDPSNFIPQTPLPETIQRCSGVGMGFCLFRIAMLRDPRFECGAWFRTAEGCTQDLYFWKKAAPFGFKCAVDTRVKVGHVDVEGVIW